jgi:hypothetical protein
MTAETRMNLAQISLRTSAKHVLDISLVSEKVLTASKREANQTTLIRNLTRKGPGT